MKSICRSLFALVVLGSLAPHAARAFSFEEITKRAEYLAWEPYSDHRGTVPKWMLAGSTSYDQWRDIRFRPDHALWRDEALPFQAQFFHPGLYYDRTVKLNVVDRDGTHALPFSTDLFDYGKNTFAEKIPKDIGYAGLRLHYPLKTPQYLDELIVFLGASYFRSLGRDQVWGLSARGIAVDTVEQSGEEFPHFDEFWLEKPQPGATKMVMYALLDGPSLSGAYRFEISPGIQTVIAVEARLFLRKEVKKLGVAPLTSMFFFGENGRRRFDDFRPEVHDSDGMLMHFDTGEWLWRPLDNPTRINASSFTTRNPRGFGLVQRDRAFTSYEDIEARSDLRPSAWVEPRGDWGDGRVELVEIPTDTEKNDNIVAYWVPARKATARERMDFSYTVSFYGDDRQRPPAGRVVATRQDSGAQGNTKRYVIDFAGASLDSIPQDRPPVANISLANKASADVLDYHVVRINETKVWRLTFQLKPKTKAPIEMRAFLADERGSLTETWSNAVLQ